MSADAAIAPRRPGRPRDDDIDGQMLDAALALIDAGEPVTVSRVVAGSGVSRAALYRRWPSLTQLIAAALDQGRVVPGPIDLGDDEASVKAAVLGALFGDPETALAGYPEQRFRQRIALAMADRGLQRAYWTSHVSRRRVSLEAALRTAIERGILRPGLDPAACFDLLAGVVYYQIVVRGDSFSDAAMRDRCRAAFGVAWEGMVRRT
jgi:AcrR family transcriptional regulator